MTLKNLVGFLAVVLMCVALVSCKKECIKCFGVVSKEFYVQCDPPDRTLIVLLAGDTIGGCAEVYKTR